MAEVDGGGDDGGSGGIVWSAISGKPEWLSDPASFIRAVVRAFLARRLIQGVLTVASFGLTAIYRPFEIGGETVVEVADILVEGVGPAATAIIDAIDAMNLAIASGAAGAGIGAPIVVWVLQVIEIIILLWVLREAARSVKPFILSFNPL